jgi:hypothetical protein
MKNMSNAKQITDELIYRMKHTSLNKFSIIREVERGWFPNGVAPFDIHASGNIVTFSVWAESLQDAEDQVSKFLERDEDE